MSWKHAEHPIAIRNMVASGAVNTVINRCHTLDRMREDTSGDCQRRGSFVMAVSRTNQGMATAWTILLPTWETALTASRLKRDSFGCGLRRPRSGVGLSPHLDGDAGRSEHSLGSSPRYHAP